jgi:hypothetical protein
MSLSEQERLLLLQIERDLTADDPRLSRRLARGRPRRWRWPRWLGDVLLAAATAAGIAEIALTATIAVWAVIPGIVVLAACLGTVAGRRVRRYRARRHPVGRRRAKASTRRQRPGMSNSSR